MSSSPIWLFNCHFSYDLLISWCSIYSIYQVSSYRRLLKELPLRFWLSRNSPLMARNVIFLSNLRSSSRPQIGQDISDYFHKTIEMISIWSYLKVGWLKLQCSYHHFCFPKIYLANIKPSSTESRKKRRKYFILITWFIYCIKKY